LIFFESTARTSHVRSQTLLGMGIDCPRVDNVVHEILDMIEATPEEIKSGISLSGMLASGNGHIVSRSTYQ
jgi:hypothetical protein